MPDGQERQQIETDIWGPKNEERLRRRGNILLVILARQTNNIYFLSSLTRAVLSSSPLGCSYPFQGGEEAGGKTEQILYYTYPSGQLDKPNTDPASHRVSQFMHGTFRRHKHIHKFKLSLHSLSAQTRETWVRNHRLAPGLSKTILAMMADPDTRSRKSVK